MIMQRTHEKMVGNWEIWLAEKGLPPYNLERRLRLKSAFVSDGALVKVV